MKEIASKLFVPLIYKEFGSAGTDALRTVLEFLPTLYASVPPENIDGRLIVVNPLVAGSLDALIGGPNDIYVEIGQLPKRVDPGGIVVLELLPSGRIRCWEGATVTDIHALAEQGVVYVYEKIGEQFVVRTQSCPVPNPAPSHLSVFARPTFSSIAQALDTYKRGLIRTSRCHLFSGSWEEEDKRLFFHPGPEKDMRRSLHQFLFSHLRDVDVLQEQNVSETEPIDIKVSWNFTRSEALIEIKWVGKSRSDEGTIVAYYDHRARDGASQLANYLDQYRTQNPNVETRGYLVVIDARRRGLNASSQSVSKADGMHYENREIEYNPEYHRIRSDFEEPVRMFAEPIWSAEESAA